MQSPEEWARVRTVAPNPQNGFIWAGGKLDTDSGKWSWTDGTPWGAYSPWGIGKHIMGHPVFRVSMVTGEWSSKSLDDPKKEFVCEIRL